jgi:hypothetical protein
MFHPNRGARGSSSEQRARTHLRTILLWALSLAERLTDDDADEAARVANVRTYLDDITHGSEGEPPIDDIAFAVGVLCAAVALPDDPDGAPNAAKIEIGAKPIAPGAGRCGIGIGPIAPAWSTYRPPIAPLPSIVPLQCPPFARPISIVCVH